MRDGGHPGAVQLTLFELGKLSDDESRQVELHLEGCPECQERVVETGANDAFIDWLRRFHQKKRTSIAGGEPLP